VEHATIGDDTLRGGTGGAAIYGIVDQMLWQEPGAKDNGIGAFLMVMGTPTAICFSDLYVEGGLNWKGPIRGRSNDVLGLGVAYLHLDPGTEKQRNGHRGHLPLRGSTLMGTAAGYSNGDQSPGWIAQPRQRSLAVQCAGDRASDDREILTLRRSSRG
jgi:porin